MAELALVGFLTSTSSEANAAGFRTYDGEINDAEILGHSVATGVAGVGVTYTVMAPGIKAKIPGVLGALAGFAVTEAIASDYISYSDGHGWHLGDNRPGK